MKIITLLIIILSCLRIECVNGQSLKWSPSHEVKIDKVDFMPRKGNEKISFNTTEYNIYDQSIFNLKEGSKLVIQSSSGFENLYYEVYNEDLRSINKKTIPLKGCFIEVVDLQSKIIALVGHRNENNDLEVLSYEFNENDNQFNAEPIKLGVIAMGVEMGLYFDINYNISISPDYSKIGIHLNYFKLISYGNALNNNILCVIDVESNNLKFKEINKDILKEIDEDDKSLKLGNFCLSNNGSLIFTTNTRNKERSKSEYMFDSRLYVLNEDLELHHIPLEEMNFYPRDLIMKSVGDEYLVCGNYSTPNDSKAYSGIFRTKISQNGELLSQNSFPIEEEFFESGEQISRFLESRNDSIFFSTEGYTAFQTPTGVNIKIYKNLKLYCLVGNELIWKQTVVKLGGQKLINSTIAAKTPNIVPRFNLQDDKLEIIHTFYFFSKSGFSNAKTSFKEIDLSIGELVKDLKITTNSENSKIKVFDAAFDNGKLIIASNYFRTMKIGKYIFD